MCENLVMCHLVHCHIKKCDDLIYSSIDLFTEDGVLATGGEVSTLPKIIGKFLGSNCYLKVTDLILGISDDVCSF